MQALQILQCLLLGDLITSHSGQRLLGSKVSIKERKSMDLSFFIFPGSLNQHSKKNIIVPIKDIWDRIC